MYILSNDNCKFISLANDTSNILFENYIFPSEITIKNQLTTEFIVIDANKQLINYCE